jgi:hypothetical protein
LNFGPLGPKAPLKLLTFKCFCTRGRVPTVDSEASSSSILDCADTTHLSKRSERDAKEIPK